MPKVNFWSDKVEALPYDLEKAKALVKEAGYDGTPIKLMVDTGNAPSKQIATILQNGWSQAGLNVEIVEFDIGTGFNMTQKGDYQAYVSYITSDINDDDELATLEGDYTARPRPSSPATRTTRWSASWPRRARPATRPSGPSSMARSRTSSITMPIACR